MKQFRYYLAISLLATLLASSFEVFAVANKPEIPLEPEQITTGTLFTKEQHEQLDAFFEGLARSESAEQADKFISRIWAIWKTPNDPQLLAMMKAAESNFVSGKRGRAFDILDHATASYPGYSEIWNQRATYYYFDGKYDESLRDIAKTLELEPRHFGALSGKMAILMRKGQQDKAVKILIEALQINPFMPERRMLQSEDKKPKGQPI